MTTSTPAQRSPEAQRKAEFAVARNVYVAIILSFVTVCAVAIYFTTKMEAEKTGFRAIETEQPMSFFDNTYVKKEQK